ncbi:nitrite/sulfite reductase [Helicobacter turcicus]|uniref:Nitrite/sulfite reductase n=1 Tax=Helicobacter turcicus TaxID=2867412 RepID=A0ABS7JQ77_9HELI|nr:nitrite/sulfite reductase [Helicobacter turcicus]MBX7491525.1 nitrite/sulfite reductase [Helicobacter turcicus]MBX7546381.1 nitrite/sulfite reductase [Helicobacter turcicus]
MSHYVIPNSVLENDFNFLIKSCEDFKNNKINEATFKAIRVPYGIYEQREKNTYMVRLKTHGGQITPHQLLGISRLAQKYANGSLHITTRGGIQLHYVKFENLCIVTKELHTLGLSGRGGGGNCVRGIVGDALSGIAKDDVFDVQPYANALTTKMLGLKDSFNLPRKFKISFSSSQADRATATITDIGFIATKKGNRKGFIVYLAGGMGSKSRLGHKFLDFLPAKECFLFAQAVKQVFDKYGNRENKHSARLRFLADKIGIEELGRLIEQEKQSVKKSLADWEIKITKPSVKLPILENQILPKMTKEENLWWNRFVREQKQTGYFYVKVPLALGDIPYKSAEKLANTLSGANPHCIAFGQNQNLYIRNLNASQMLKLYPILTEFSLQSKQASIFGDMVACTGAATCQLGIARPRGAVLAIEEYLLQQKIDLDKLQDFRIQLSGCPNSCGNHLTANLGFFGKIQRKGGVPYPCYNVVAGGVIEEGKTRFAKKITQIAAFYLPEFIYKVLSRFLKVKGKFKTFEDWVDSSGEAEIVSLAESFGDIPSFEENPKPYYDWSSDELFSVSLKKNGIGEEN